jgi:NAD(P)-dependent dehydrogenase (short-subunit alcohol dehydrogenase family)
MKSLRELADLSGRVALVTGGAGHIGSVLSEALAELGCAIAVLDLDRDETNDLAQRIHDNHAVQALALPIDLADERALRSVSSQVIDRLGRLDILVNCAAMVGTSELKGWVTPFAEQSSEAWRLAVEINLTAPFILTQACSPALSESTHGSVINVGSIYGLTGPDLRLYEGTGMGNPAAYAASKGGLLQLTRWLATVLAPQVRVNAVTPGGIWRNQPERFTDRYIARTPLQRMATEEDLKGAVAYLASDLSAYVTGQNLIVDGGWTTW